MREYLDANPEYAYNPTVYGTNTPTKVKNITVNVDGSSYTCSTASSTPAPVATPTQEATPTPTPVAKSVAEPVSPYVKIKDANLNAIELEDNSYLYPNEADPIYIYNTRSGGYEKKLWKTFLQGIGKGLGKQNIDILKNYGYVIKSGGSTRRKHKKSQWLSKRNNKNKKSIKRSTRSRKYRGRK